METITKITLEEIKEFIPETTSLYYVERSDSLDNCMKVIASCIANESKDELLQVIDERMDETEHYSINYELSELIDKMGADCGYDRQDLEDAVYHEYMAEICNILRERDDSTPMGTILRYTNDIPVIVELMSNGDCINSHYFEGGYRYDEHNSYFKDMVDVLMLNPKKVKDEFEKRGIKVFGRWPNKKSREEKSIVKVEDFAKEIENSSSPANSLTFLTRLNVSDLMDADFKVKVIDIPKGNNVGLFSSSYGGGSIMDMELQRCFRVKLGKHGDKYPYLALFPDVKGAGYGYSTDEVYACGGDLSGGTAEIIKEN